MGWTSYHATHYKNGKVDRKAECDALFEEGGVLKSAMVGSTYYAAIKHKSGIGAVIFLTSTDMKDYFNFSYKDMDETMGPYNYDCPKGILDLLTPTENEYANNWRAACREQLAKKNNPNSLQKLPIGSEIQFTLEHDTTLNKAGSVITLRKTNAWSKKAYWMQPDRHIKWSSDLINRMTNGNYIVIKKGEK